MDTLKTEDHFGRGPKGYLPKDERIERAIYEALKAEKLIDASDVSVKVLDGVVTLTGSVSDQESKKYAMTMAKEIKAVKDVINLLRLRSGHGLVGEMDWPI